MKILNTLFVLSCLAFSFIFLSPLVSAQSGGSGNSPISGTDKTNIKENLCTGSDLSFKGKADCTDEQNQDPREKTNKLIANIVNIISIIVGIIAVIMIIIGALRFITSGGDSGKVASARSTIIYAIVGLVIVALAQFIVKFVLAKATGVDNANATI